MLRDMSGDIRCRGIRNHIITRDHEIIPVSLHATHPFPAIAKPYFRIIVGRGDYIPVIVRKCQRSAAPISLILP